MQINVAYFAHAANLTGANRSLIELLCSIRKKGVEPIVFLPWNGLIETELKYHNIKYHVIPYKRWFCKTDVKLSWQKRMSYIFRGWYNTIYAKHIANLIKQNHIQLVHSNSMLIGFGAQVAHAAGLPHIWHIREYMEEDHHVTFDNEKRAEKYARQAAALIAVSDRINYKYAKKWDRDIVTVYNGVDIEKYSIASKQIMTHPKIELMIVGRIVESKGQMEAIKAISLLNERNYNIHLRIIGNGADDRELENINAYIKSHHLQDTVECIPFQSDLSSYYLTNDIQLVCSHNEAFGRVTIEGMLSHSLVIGANAGYTPYLLEDEQYGLLYDCGDPQSLAEKIEWAIVHKEQAQIIADAGYKHGQQFSIEETATKVMNLYLDILNGYNQSI